MLYVEHATTDDFLKIELGHYTHVIIVNDSGGNSIQFSFNSSDKHGVIKPNETLTFDDLNKKTIYFKSDTALASANMRLWAWGNPELLYGSENFKMNVRKQKSFVPQNIKGYQ